MSDKNGSPDELQWLIEDRKRRLDDLEEQAGSTSDQEIRKGIEGMIEMLREEIADLERQLEGSDRSEDFDGEIADLDSKIRDINSQMEMETDPIVRNNLEVSKRYLQMERNGILIRQTQKTKRKDPHEERIEELEELSESRLRLINDLQKRLKSAEKDLSYYKALSENPERRVSCDRTRVSVTAEELTRIRNESKLLSVECSNLRKENRELRNQMDLQRRNVQELTIHCRDADSQIIILQSRIQKLMKEAEGRE